MNTFYEYLKFDEERLKGIFYGWDEDRGNHAAVLKRCADLLVGRTVLDMGCGLCHLYELIKEKIVGYSGVDIDERIVGWAKERYPYLDIKTGNADNLSEYGRYDTVYAIGLFRRINTLDTINELLRHADRCLIVTNFHTIDEVPFPLWSLIREEKVYSVEVIASRIRGTDILRIHVIKNI